MRRVALVAALVGLAATGCGITRVDAPVSFKAEHRLDVEAPEPEAEVQLPVTVRWTADDYPRHEGEHFALFVDRAPIAPDREVRFRVCTEGEKQPPQLGQLRKPCKDDRETIFLTTRTSFAFDCFEPRFTAPKRERNKHTVTIVLLDRDGRRIGEDASSVRFEIDERDARRCRGLEVTEG